MCSLNPLTPGHFAKKMPFEVSQALFRSLSSQKESKLSKTLFTSRALDQLLFLMPNYSFQRSGMRRKQNFEKVSLPFHLLPFAFSPPHLFCFSFPPFFFCGAFTRLPFGGNRFCKTFEDHEFFLKEVPVDSGTSFSLEFIQSYTVFCAFLWSV